MPDFEDLEPFAKSAPLRVSDLRKIYRNQDFINQLKAETKIRNVDPVANDEGQKIGREPPTTPFLIDNVVYYTDLKSYVIKQGDIYGDSSDRFNVRFTFPQVAGKPMFDKNYQPTVVVTPVHPHLEDIIVTIREIDSVGQSFVLTVIEISDLNSLKVGTDYWFNILAIGVAGFTSTTTGRVRPGRRPPRPERPGPRSRR